VARSTQERVFFGTGIKRQPALEISGKEMPIWGQTIVGKEKTVSMEARFIKMKN
jgi:hypothetical protein